MTIVCGTQSKPETITYYQLFAVYIANELVKQHHLDVRIVPDFIYQNYDENDQTNVFLIGGPKSNIVTRSIMEENSNLPISFTEQGDLNIGDCTIACDRQTAALFLAPHGNRLSFVVSGSSLSMLQSVVNILPLHTGFDSFPDFVVLDKSHEWKGGNAIHATGFWDAEWKLSPQASFVQCPLYHPSQENCDVLW